MNSYFESDHHWPNEKTHKKGNISYIFIALFNTHILLTLQFNSKMPRVDMEILTSLKVAHTQTPNFTNARTI